MVDSGSEKRELMMAFTFEELKVYQRALDFAVDVIEIIDKIDAPRKHYKLIEQLEASCTSVASNISGLINSIKASI